MKRLHLFLIKSFLGPFIATFFIAIFLLLMQFLWKYIDDLVGKGLEFTQIAENVDKPLNFVAIPVNIDYLYDNYYKEKVSTIYTFGIN